MTFREILARHIAEGKAELQQKLAYYGLPLEEPTADLRGDVNRFLRGDVPAAPTMLAPTVCVPDSGTAEERLAAVERGNAQYTESLLARPSSSWTSAEKEWVRTAIANYGRGRQMCSFKASRLVNILVAVLGAGLVVFRGVWL